MLEEQKVNCQYVNCILNFVSYIFSIIAGIFKISFADL